MPTDPRRLTKDDIMGSDFDYNIRMFDERGGGGRISGVWLTLNFDDSHRVQGSEDYEFSHSLNRVPQRFLVAGGIGGVKKGSKPWTKSKVYFQTDTPGGVFEVFLI